MTRLAIRHGAINLAQGFPDFPAPAVLKQRRGRSHRRRHQSVRHHLGRQAVSRRHRRQVPREPMAWNSTPSAKSRSAAAPPRAWSPPCSPCWIPGDEVVLFEPFYENYGPDTQLCGADLALRQAARAGLELRPRGAARAPSLPRPKPSSSTRRTIPPAKFSLATELEYIAGLCQEFDCLAITDEIYEHILYDGAVHIPIMSLPGMRERSILVNSMSKTYSVTGWRVGWVLAPPDLTDSIRKVHDFLTVGAAAPLAAGRGDSAFTAGRLLRSALARSTPRAANTSLPAWKQRDSSVFCPQGAYYVMTDISELRLSPTTLHSSIT